MAHFLIFSTKSAVSFDNFPVSTFEKAPIITSSIMSKTSVIKTRISYSTSPQSTPCKTFVMALPIFVPSTLFMNLSIPSNKPLIVLPMVSPILSHSIVVNNLFTARPNSSPIAPHFKVFTNSEIPANAVLMALPIASAVAVATLSALSSLNVKRPFMKSAKPLPTLAALLCILPQLILLSPVTIFSAMVPPTPSQSLVLIFFKISSSQPSTSTSLNLMALSSVLPPEDAEDELLELSDSLLATSKLAICFWYSLAFSAASFVASACFCACLALYLAIRLVPVNS